MTKFELFSKSVLQYHQLFLDDRFRSTINPRPEEDAASQIDRPGGSIPWNVALPVSPFDKEAFDKLVDVGLLMLSLRPRSDRL
jgi:hypothetical protein